MGTNYQVDKASRPLMSVIFILAFSPLAYLQLIPEKGGEIFNWLLALSGLSTLFTWGAICLTHIRFRRAWKVQGHSLEELPFTAIAGVTGSWIGLILVILVLIAQFYIVSMLRSIKSLAEHAGCLAPWLL
jgi:amino acid transporter